MTKAKSKRRQELHDFKRAAIVAAAERMFLSEGIEGASLRAIARAAGYTPGALYAYYASKEELYAEILRRSLDRLLQAVQRGASGKDAGPLVSGAVRGFWRFYRDHPTDLSLSLYVQHGLGPKGLTPKLDRELNERLQASLDIIQRGLAQLGKTASRAQLQRHTTALLSAVMGVLLLTHTGRLKTLGGDPDRLVDHHIALAIAAVAKR